VGTCDGIGDVRTPLAQIDQPLCVPGRRQTVHLYPDRVEILRRGFFLRERRFCMLHALPEQLDRLRDRRLHRVGTGAALLAGGLLLFALGRRLPFPEALDYLPSMVGFILVLLGLLGLSWGLFAPAESHVLTYKPFDPDAADLAIRADRPNREAAQAFVAHIQEARRRLLDAHLRAEELPDEAEQLRKFADLHARDILTDDEFTRVKARILGASRGRPGFGPKPTLDFPDKQGAPPSPG